MKGCLALLSARSEAVFEILPPWRAGLHLYLPVPGNGAQCDWMHDLPMSPERVGSINNEVGLNEVLALLHVLQCQLLHKLCLSLLNR